MHSRWAGRGCRETHLHVALPADEPDVADEHVGQFPAAPGRSHRQRPGFIPGFGRPQAHRPAAPVVGDGFGRAFVQLAWTRTRAPGRACPAHAGLLLEHHA